MKRERQPSTPIYSPPYIEKQSQGRHRRERGQAFIHTPEIEQKGGNPTGGTAGSRHGLRVFFRTASPRHVNSKHCKCVPTFAPALF